MCALYPIFPKDTSDNKYHLQALRHFWALSIENPVNLIKNVEK
jgi:anaphase-promoting complex subunit 1